MSWNAQEDESLSTECVAALLSFSYPSMIHYSYFFKLTRVANGKYLHGAHVSKVPTTFWARKVYSAYSVKQVFSNGNKTTYLETLSF